MTMEVTVATSRAHVDALLPIGLAMKEQLRPRARDVVAVQIAFAYLSKALQTLQAINLLLDAGLHEEAQALVRVLFETRIAFDYFKQLAQADAREAAIRYLDAVVIEKHKQYRASGYAGPAIIDGIEVRAGIERDMAAVAARRPAEEVRRMQRHGFTGLNVEELARQTGHDTKYQILYRNFSRNVHGRDFTETLLREDLVQPSPLLADYLHIRGQVTINCAFDLAHGLLAYVNHNFDLPLQVDLDRAHAAWDAARDRNPDAAAEEEPADAT